jgi:hypothetical protein
MPWLTLASSSHTQTAQEERVLPLMMVYLHIVVNSYRYDFS